MTCYSTKEINQQLYQGFAQQNPWLYILIKNDKKYDKIYIKNNCLLAQIVSTKYNLINKMKNKYTLSQQFRNPIEKIVERGKINTLSNKYMTTHIPGLVQV